MVFLDGIFTLLMVVQVLEVQCTEFEYIDVKVQFNEAVADCEARGKILAIIDTPEKFNIVYDLLTNNGRGMPSAPVYIGLKYNTVNKQHEWLDGTPVTWVNWYINEPFSVETRHCVRLDLDSNLQYRTTDCTYQHNYVCSSEGGESSMVPTSSKKSSNDVMIVGLSVGFGVSAAVIALCCLMCYCCCSSRDQPKRPLIQYKCPSKPRAVVGNLSSVRNGKPPEHAVYYSKHSSGRNSNNTSRTGSSRIEDYDDEMDAAIIDTNDRRMSVYSGGTGDYQRSSASPRDPNDILHYI